MPTSFLWPGPGSISAATHLVLSLINRIDPRGADLIFRVHVGLCLFSVQILENTASRVSGRGTDDLRLAS